MAKCLSPDCGGQVDVFDAAGYVGRCDTCGLNHRRTAGTIGWNQIVGLLTVTLAAPPTVEELAADRVVFAGRTVTIELGGGGLRTVLAEGLVSVTRG